VGALLFRDDPSGRACLTRWREQCLEWCKAIEEDGKYGDQKYLDEWPEKYGEKLAIARSAGAGVGPWNLRGRSATPGDPPRIEGVPVVYTHFSSLSMISPRLYKITDAYAVRGDHKRALYAPYLRALRDALAEVRRVSPGFSRGLEGIGLRTIANGVRRHRLMTLVGDRMIAL
jgi:hypothetical protein